MMSMGYFTICITDKPSTPPHEPVPTKKFVHCFRIPEFVDTSNFTKEPPTPNFPELELAGTVLSLVEYVEPLVKDTGFTKELAEVVNKFVHKVREGLPEGVELKRVRPKLAKAA